MKTKRKEIDRVNNEFSEFSLSSPARKIRRLDLDLPPIMEEEDEMIQSAAPVNEERAIVLYKPLQHYQIVDTDLISGFKKRFLLDALVSDDLYDDDDDGEPNKRQAVVSWEPRTLEITELDGEDEMMEEAAMDVEEASPPQFRGGLHQWQQQQQQVVLAANELPSINDVTYIELAEILSKLKDETGQLMGVDTTNLLIANSGNDLPVIDLSRVSQDLVILEGMGRGIETNLYAQFKCDSLKIGMVKHPEVAQFLGGRLYDCVIKYNEVQS